MALFAPPCQKLRNLTEMTEKKIFLRVGANASGQLRSKGKKIYCITYLRTLMAPSVFQNSNIFFYMALVNIYTLFITISCICSWHILRTFLPRKILPGILPGKNVRKMRAKERKSASCPPLCLSLGKYT